MGLSANFILGGVFFSFVSAVLLLIRREYQFRARLLAAVQLAFGWYALLYLLVLSGDILKAPLLYRVGAPIYYIVPPFIYFYCRSIIKGRNSLDKLDYLHLLPVLLSYIDLLPYFLLPAGLKVQQLQAIVANPDLSFQLAGGFLPAITHFLWRPLQGLAYLPLLWGLVLAAYSTQAQFPQKKIRWVFWLISLFTVLYGSLAVVTYRGYATLETESHILFSQASMVLFITLVFFLFSASLFFWPTILYGFGLQESSPSPEVSQPRVAGPLAVVAVADPAERNDALSEKEEMEPLVNEQLMLEYALSLKEVILERELYRNQKLSINELSVMLGIPSKTLSYVINQHYQMRFNDYINSFRVCYIIERFMAGDWKDLSMEGLGKEAGFSSRTTFFNAFKKYTGTSPSDYLKQQHYPSMAS
ncbi:AraC family transcriptional regulator [Pedobacter sp. SYSU D00535]|uniref:helix-turn-helix domain-containing protein n=1 Tax=Pedobacter sp. SYSU D00535 TaxID=2810308 RepID=UPI001A962D43|nr:helix-turn-helix domain-containing protein [Pedobacter sp. SYSU D00535]